MILCSQSPIVRTEDWNISCKRTLKCSSCQRLHGSGAQEQALLNLFCLSAFLQLPLLGITPQYGISHYYSQAGVYQGNKHGHLPLAPLEGHYCATEQKERWQIGGNRKVAEGKLVQRWQQKGRWQKKSWYKDGNRQKGGSTKKGGTKVATKGKVKRRWQQKGKVAEGKMAQSQHLIFC